MLSRHFLWSAVMGCLLVLSPAHAQSRADALIDLLSELPAAMADDRTLSIEFADLRIARQVAALALLRGHQGDAAVLPFVRVGPRIWATTLRSTEGVNAAASGFDPFAIDAVLSARAGPATATLLLYPDQVPTHLGDALQTIGYARQTDWGPNAVWARGQEDNAIDPAAANSADLLGRGLGLSSRIWAAGDLLRHATEWPLLEGMIIADSPRLATGNSAIEALLMALDQPGTGPGQLAAAEFLIPEERTFRVFPIMTADLVNGNEDHAILAMLLPMGMDANLAEQNLRENWARQNGDRIRDADGNPAPIGTGVFPHDGETVLWLSTGGPRDDQVMALRNEAATRMMQLVMTTMLPRLLTP